MTDEERQYFELLKQRRIAIVDDEDDPARMNAMELLVNNKYGDNAHFVFELIQNASDADATYARFELFKDKLIFAHNGRHPFTITNPEKKAEAAAKQNGTLGSVNAITSQANSTKRNLEGRIGKFGIGFKSVFRYSSSPVIYSLNDFYFRLERMIIPHLLEDDSPYRRENETLFVLPFDSKQMLPAKAFEDIANRLRNLSYPTLFLNNGKAGCSGLTRIEYAICEEKGEYSRRIVQCEYTNGLIVEHLQLISNCQKAENVLLFSKIESGHRQSVAFFTSDNNEFIPKQLCAFCYLPTHETTGLNYVLHAPFLLNDSRAEIKEDENGYNEALLNNLALLTRDALLYLKNSKPALIQDDILNLIPITEKCTVDLSQMLAQGYRRVYQTVMETLRDNALLPGADGGNYISSVSYYTQEKQLIECFSDDDLSVLVETEAHWVFTNVRGDNDKELYLKNILGEQRILDGTKILKRMTADFIQTRSIDWLCRLYEYIGENNSRIESSKTLPILLDSSERPMSAYDANGKIQLFLPPKDCSYLQDEGPFSFVSRRLLDNPRSMSFLKDKMGLHTPEDKDIFEKIVLNGCKAPNSTKIPPMELFLQAFNYYKKNDISGKNDIIRQLKKCSIIPCYYFENEKEDSVEFQAGDWVLFPTDELREYFDNNNFQPYFLSQKIYDRIPKANEADLHEFLKDLGVRDWPGIWEDSLFGDDPEFAKNNGIITKNKCFSSIVLRVMCGLEWALNNCESEPKIEKRARLSHIIWKYMLKLLEVENRPLNRIFEEIIDGREKKTKEDKYLIRKLCATEWLQDANGKFRCPERMAIQELHHSYNTDSPFADRLMKSLKMKDAVVYNECSEEEMEILKYARECRTKGIDPQKVLSDACNRPQSRHQTSNVEEKQGGDNHRIPVPLPTIDNANFSDCGDDFARDSDIAEEYEDNAIERFAIEDLPDVSEVTTSSAQRVDNWEGKQKRLSEQYNRSIQALEEKQMLQKSIGSIAQYTYGWFNKCLECEQLLENETGADGKEITIFFGAMSQMQDCERTYCLKNPSRTIPNWLEELDSIQMPLYFGRSTTPHHVHIEAMSVRNTNELIVKLRSSVALEHEGMSLKTLSSAVLQVTRPAFLLDSLQQGMKELRYSDDYNLQVNLPQNIRFIFGPPGTGKTTFLANNILLPMMKRECRVLVMTPTNKSADVLVGRILSKSKEKCLPWLVRFGSCADETIDRNGIKTGKEIDVQRQKRLVMVTTIARFPYDKCIPGYAEPVLIKDMNWDCIIIDEASMIPLVNILYPIFLKQQCSFIIAGDPFQIEPIVKCESWKGENIYTMTQLTDFSSPHTIPRAYQITRLSTQYRGLSCIGELFSRYKYNGDLQHDRKEPPQLLNLSDCSIGALSIIKFPIREDESIYALKTLKDSPYHIYSAIFAYEFVCHIARKLSVSPTRFRIGVISPYRVQADLVQHLIQATRFPDFLQISANTVHGFQGDECEMIIAICNPPPYKKIPCNSHINNQNVINVAISRAKDYFVLLMPDDNFVNIEQMTEVRKIERLMREQNACCSLMGSISWEKLIFGNANYIEENTFTTGHQFVNVYAKPEKKYEVRCDSNAIDIQITDLSS